jgi:hypothetical protein
MTCSLTLFDVKPSESTGGWRDARANRNVVGMRLNPAAGEQA